MILLVLDNDREGAPQPFLAERVRDRGLGPNVQLFHRAPPSPHFAGRARERRNGISPAYSAATSSPAFGPPGQSFYGLRLPHRTVLSLVQMYLGLSPFAQSEREWRTFTSRHGPDCQLAHQSVGGARADQTHLRAAVLLSQWVGQPPRSPHSYPALATQSANTTGQDLTVRLIGLTGAPLATCVTPVNGVCSTPFVGLGGGFLFQCTVSSGAGSPVNGGFYRLGVQR